MTCPHENLYWYLAVNEDGWKCLDCDERPGEPPGYSPAHDVSHLRVKVESILSDLHDAKFIYVSNGCAGDGIVESITRQCARDGIYDQYGITKAILDGILPGKSTYWKKVGDGVRSGNDERERCPCGQLARAFVGRARFCSKHSPDWDESIEAATAKALADKEARS